MLIPPPFQDFFLGIDGFNRGKVVHALRIGPSAESGGSSVTSDWERPPCQLRPLLTRSL